MIDIAKMMPTYRYDKAKKGAFHSLLAKIAQNKAVDRFRKDERYAAKLKRFAAEPITISDDDPFPMGSDSYLCSADALRQTESAQGAALHPGQLLDGMRVVAFLGRGTTSEVWRVHDLQQDCDYALKIFAPTPDTPAQARQRFLTEAQALDEFRRTYGIDIIAALNLMRIWYNNAQWILNRLGVWCPSPPSRRWRSCTSSSTRS